jgi:hypothetical protein
MHGKKAAAVLSELHLRCKRCKMIVTLNHMRGLNDVYWTGAI